MSGRCRSGRRWIGGETSFGAKKVVGSTVRFGQWIAAADCRRVYRMDWDGEMVAITVSGVIVSGHQGSEC